MLGFSHGRRSWSFRDKCVPKLELGNEGERAGSFEIAARKIN
jgi:hypothetical protein